MQASDMLKSFTDKKYIYFFNSGDDAILYIMKYLKAQGFSKILIPDCGGWFSYKKFPKKIGLEIVEIKTDDALLDLQDLKSKISDDAFLLINSMGGYFVEEPMDDITKICRNIVNDVSASIGTKHAKAGDFCCGSFGADKPIDIGIGGFLGSNIDLKIKNSEFSSEKNLKALEDALNILSRKLSFWKNQKSKIINDLKVYNILHCESSGINVVVAFESDDEKTKLINYCTTHVLQYKMCPNYIKVNRQAISIEVKRIKEVNYDT